MANIVGILNVTSDSFSDGGKFLLPDNAIKRAKELIKEGATWLDIGAESSNPDGAKISVETELERLSSILEVIQKESIQISVDTYKPEVMKYALEHNVNMINDITGLRDDRAIEVLQQYSVPVVIMFARNLEPHAERAVRSHTTILDEIKLFFDERLRALEQAGIKKERIILDPGMGFFLGSNPEPSLVVLKALAVFKKYFNCPLYISTSRKSFIGSVLDCQVGERTYGTLATEIWAYLEGVDYIRTHNVKALSDGMKMLKSIQNQDISAYSESFRGANVSRW